MIKSFILRLISIDDLNDLRSISIETFKQTFAAQNTRENIRLYLKNKISTKQLRKEICDPNSKFYFVSERYLSVFSGVVSMYGSSSEPELLIPGSCHHFSTIPSLITAIYRQLL